MLRDYLQVCHLDICWYIPWCKPQQLPRNDYPSPVCRYRVGSAPQTHNTMMQ